MQNKNEIISKPVGVAPQGNPHNKGITLIALIITIIVMLILVAVTVSVALNGGLFETAKNAAEGTQIEADREVLQAGIVGALNEELEIENAETLEDNLPTGWKVSGSGLYIATSPNENQFIISTNGETAYQENSEYGTAIAIYDISASSNDNVKITFYDSQTAVISGTGNMKTNPLNGIDYIISSLIIEEGVTNVGTAAFYNNTDLTNVYISDTVTRINDSAFCGCTNLKKVYIGRGVSLIDTAAFSGCISLNDLTIPTSACLIYQNEQFTNCANIEKLTILNSDKNMISYRNSNNAPWSNSFYKLKEIKIENGVTYISDYAFVNAASAILYLPSTISSLGYYSLCLKTIYCETQEVADLISQGTSPNRPEVIVDSSKF